MQSGEELPEQDHFAIQCSRNRFSDGEEPFWLMGKAFEPSEFDPSISGFWVERVDSEYEDQLKRVRQELANSDRIVRSTHKLAVIQVQTTIDLGSKYDRELHVIFDPVSDLPSHSEIQGITPENLRLHQKLADACNIVPAT